MVLGKICNTGSKNKKTDMECIRFVRSTRNLGRKCGLSNSTEAASNLSTYPPAPPSQKQRVRSLHFGGSNYLESLPQDILFKIICKVNHSDLKQLLAVSKYVNKTAMIAKESHFDFKTPPSKPVFVIEPEDREEPPNTPQHRKFAKSRTNGGKLSGIVVVLFTSPGKGLLRDNWVVEV